MEKLPAICVLGVLSYKWSQILRGVAGLCMLDTSVGFSICLLSLSYSSLMPNLARRDILKTFPLLFLLLVWKWHNPPWVHQQHWGRFVFFQRRDVSRCLSPSSKVIVCARDAGHVPGGYSVQSCLRKWMSFEPGDVHLAVCLVGLYHTCGGYKTLREEKQQVLFDGAMIAW